MRLVLVLLCLLPATAFAGVLPADAGDVPALDSPPVERAPQLEVQQLSCALCDGAVVGGVLAFATAYVATSAHMVSVWSRPSDGTNSDNATAATVGLMASGMVDVIALGELIPVAGPLIGLMLEPNPNIQTLLLIDAGAQLGGLVIAATGWGAMDRVHVAPMAAPGVVGVGASGTF